MLLDSTGVACHRPLITWNPANASAPKASTSNMLLNTLRMVLRCGE